MDELEIVQTTMMQVAGGSHKFRHELSLLEFNRQGEQYQSLDSDNLNQVYKFLLYNDLLSMLSHPFPVERLTFLAEWSRSEELARFSAATTAPVERGLWMSLLPILWQIYSNKSVTCKQKSIGLRA